MQADFNFFEWIDKKVDILWDNHTFKKYFEGISLSNVEDVFYLTNEEMGVEIVMNIDKTIESIHFFSGTNLKYGPFTENLPYNLCFSDKRYDVLKKVGTPAKSGGGEEVLLFGFIPKWDKYYYDSYSLHIQYEGNNGCIDMVTIGSLLLEPYFMDSKVPE